MAIENINEKMETATNEIKETIQETGFLESLDPKSVVVGAVIAGLGIVAGKKVIKPRFDKIKGFIDDKKIENEKKKSKENKDEVVDTIIVDEKDVTVEDKK